MNISSLQIPVEAGQERITMDFTGGEHTPPAVVSVASCGEIGVDVATVYAEVVFIEQPKQPRRGLVLEYTRWPVQHLRITVQLTVPAKQSGTIKLTACSKVIGQYEPVVDE